MGIDAEIIIRKVPKGKVTDDWLKEISWKLCESIGASKFFIQDGSTPEVVQEWDRKFREHIVYKQEKAFGEKRALDDTMRKEIIAEIGVRPEERRLAIEKTCCGYREDGDPPPGSVYRQDGDPITADGDECLLQVNVWGRYYGEGYERGDILSYCAIAEWLEENIPGCEIWYGGDSSRVLASLFDDQERRRLRNHLYGKSGREYFHRPFGDAEIKPPACSLCPDGQYHGTQYGTGKNYAAFSCAGCGKNHCSNDNGKTWKEGKENE